jgi:hypothetical protein
MRAVAALCAAVVVLAACSSNGMPLDEYAAAVEGEATDYADEVSSLFEQNVGDLDTAVSRLQDEVEGEALVAAALAETARLASMLFAGISDASDRFVADLDALDAPASLEAEHRAYLDALAASREGAGALLPDLAAATTFDDIDRAIGSSGFSDAQPRVDAACKNLQQAIREQGPSVDLRCIRAE